MNINRNNLGKVVNLGKNECPMINYKYQDIEGILKRFFCVKRNVDMVLGRILSQFGFTKNDIITLTNIIYEGDNITFNYMVNGVEDKNNKITLEFANLIYEYRMVVSDKDKDVTCKVTAFNHKNISFSVTMIEEKLENDVVYFCNYNLYNSVYGIRIKDTELQLCLGIKIKSLDSKNILVLGKTICVQLEKYLKNINFPISIETLYKDIVEYLGDTNVYSNIDLKIIDIVNSKVTDMISLKNGVCEKIKITRGNRSVTLDKDGNWVSDYSNEYCNISMIMSEGNTTYSISANNEETLKEQIFIQGVDGYDKTLGEVDYTKRLVREMFPKKK